MKVLPESMTRAIEEFKKLPTVGDKTAMRFVYYIAERGEEFIDTLSNAILDLKKSVKLCSKCFNYSEELDICELCTNPGRDSRIVCVVPEPKDVVTLSACRGYKGMFHVLHGLISPMDGISPGHLKIKPLYQRVIDDDISEVIFALGSSVNATATALYMSKHMKPAGIKISELAQGIAVGAELETADIMTLDKALINRRVL